MTQMSWLGVRLISQVFGNACLPGYIGGRLSILIYHRVLKEQDSLQPDIPDEKIFRWQMQLLKRYFNVLSLRDALCRLRDNTLPERSVCVTFDDGYSDNVTVALPILKELDVPATFFIASGFLNGGSMWNDVVFELMRNIECGVHEFSEVPDFTSPVNVEDNYSSRRKIANTIIQTIKYLDYSRRQFVIDKLNEKIKNTNTGLMMTSCQVRELFAAGMEIGAHTLSHPILAKLPAEAARREIDAGRAKLEELINAPVRILAYPNGKPGEDYLPEHAAMAKEMGFEAAVSTSWGVSDALTDRYQLARFTPWDTTPMRFAARLLMNGRSLHRPMAVAG
ncbi:polysaccharide deacetylase family protein [Plasticicumulans acidivorans]|uniref:Polysaccharide deacetylase n=1 Tax=Plasticicumulans acidivorans TaxID=886464 RepID=A0A317MUR0_9GAMM|nr:polysaccharide deacetylase family protein [Plasticicumulans acidivorans]PWV61117.1 polysaccharide deacetylase [Plasticicumulans acidivorans]